MSASLLRTAGFTLLEMMVALVVGGMAVAGAAALYAELASRAEAIDSTSRAVSRDANAERLLHALALAAEPRGRVPAVRGDADAVTLATWCETAEPWPEPCRVRVAFQPDGARLRLVLQRVDAADSSSSATPEDLVLRDGVRSGRFLYLVDPAHGGSWAGAWSEPATPPALALVIDGDTLFFPTR